MQNSSSKRIFISYRRMGGGAGFALSLYEGLRTVVGAENVFFDVSEGAIRVGNSWRDAVRTAIAGCDTFLIIVDDLFAGNVKNIDDPLRIEFECALELNLRIVPVYIGAITPPAKDALPESLHVFPDLHAVRIRLESSPKDMKAVIAEVTGEDERKTVVKASLSRLPVTGREVFGRDNELEKLTAAWHAPDIHIVTLVAWGGVGKSAIMNHWLRSLGKNFAGAERVYAWSFFSQGAGHKAPSGDVFVDAALTWFGDPDPSRGSPWERGERLAQMIKSHRTLLLLDGLEPLQYPPGQDEGRLRDTSVHALLRELSISNPGLVVISTRLPVADFVDYEGTRVEQIELENLSPDAGGQLLRSLGVKGDDDELRAASSEFNGHSLALTLLGSYLTDVFEGDIRHRSDIGPLEEDVRFGGHARRVMESYENWFGENSPENALLRVLGLFDRPASPKAIADICRKPAIKNLTEPLVGISTPKYRQLLSRLRRTRLLVMTESGQKDYVDTHPLIREHFGHKLKENNIQAWREANSRLYDHYCKSTKEFPETVEEMEPLFQAMKCGCRAGRETDALRDVYQKRIMRGEEYYAGFTLGSPNPLLAVLSQFFENDDWTMPVEEDLPEHQGLSRPDQLTVLTHVGWFLTATQSYAAPDVGKVFTFAETMCQDDTELFPILRGLWVFGLVRANLDMADSRAEKLLEIASRDGRSNLLVEAYLAKGLTAVYRGNFAESRAYLAKCLELYDIDDHHLNSFMYGNDPGATARAFDGFAAWLVGAPDTAVEQCQSALQLAQKVGHPFTITLILYVYTMVYQARGDIGNTKAYAEKLIDFCKRQGSTHFLSQGKVFSAWADFHSGDDPTSALAKMLAGLDEHLNTGAIITHTYHLAFLAEVYAKLSDYERGLELIDQGLVLIDEHGDRRWEADLYRVRGDLLIEKPDPDVTAARLAYDRSLEIAREQGAKSFVLRTTIRICRMMCADGRHEEARDRIRIIYDSMSEGHETGDLAEAKSFLHHCEEAHG